METLLEEDIDELMTNVARIGFCEACASEEKCEKVETCADVLRLLKVLRPHCQNIRTILTRFYHIRSRVNWLYRFKHAVLEGDFDNFISLVEQHEADVPIEMQASLQHHSEQEARREFGHLIENFEMRIRNHEIYPCYCCKVLHSKDQVSINFIKLHLVSSFQCKNNLRREKNR